MEQGLKQRLIGATVLVSLAVIFIPMLVGEDPQRNQEIQLDIPKRPAPQQSKILPLPEQKPEQLVKVEIDPAKKQPVKVEAPAPVEAESKPASTLQSWVVQVGSFSSRDNADKFSKVLQSQGFDAFVQDSRVDNKDVFKVVVGPEISRDKADVLSQSLKKLPQVNSTWVTRYP